MGWPSVDSPPVVVKHWHRGSDKLYKVRTSRRFRAHTGYLAFARRQNAVSTVKKSYTVQSRELYSLTLCTIIRHDLQCLHDPLMTHGNWHAKGE